MPEIARCIWCKIKNETDERGPENIVFLHLLAVDVVHKDQPNEVSALKHQYS